MGSLTLSFLREHYPGKTDAEIAKILTEEDQTLVAVVRYKNDPEAEDFTNIGTCDSNEAVDGYYTSPYCHATEMLVDRRTAPANPQGDAHMITEDDILYTVCSQCMEFPDERSLTLHAGNDYYVCPYCRDFFCEHCVKTLPLSEGTHGVPLCPLCEAELIRALPGAFFKDRT
jgi:hypothetical protein